MSTITTLVWYNSVIYCVSPLILLWFYHLFIFLLPYYIFLLFNFFDFNRKILNILKKLKIFDFFDWYWSFFNLFWSLSIDFKLCNEIQTQFNWFCHNNYFGFQDFQSKMTFKSPFDCDLSQNLGLCRFNHLRSESDRQIESTE